MKSDECQEGRQGDVIRVGRIIDGKLVYILRNRYVLDEQVEQSRKPFPPDIVIDALQDVVHFDFKETT